MEERSWNAYVAEFVGTFLLVLFICSVVSVASGLQVFDFAVIGLVHVLVLAMLVYTLGGTSGAHFNPAVTVSLAVLRKIKPVDGAIYILLQLAGAVLGALVCKVLFDVAGEAVHYGATTPGTLPNGGPVGTGVALLAEGLGTFVLLWAITGLAVNPEGEKPFAGLIIGGALGFAVMVFAPLSGAGFNPARSFGPAIVSGTWTDFWIYVVGPLVGGVVAAVLFTVLVIKPRGQRGDRPVDDLPA